jgi:DNA transposition AAA+ family ATPase
MSSTNFSAVPAANVTDIGDVADVANGSASSRFIVTKEHRRFAEFCDACRRERYIGLCHGAPGVGKTLSAQYYSKGTVEGPNEGFPILYTPPVANNPKQIAKDVKRLRDAGRYRGRVERTRSEEHEGRLMPIWPPPDRTELLIVDEADRLKMGGLEQLRDIYDRGGLGLVLIGMPGLEKRLARYPQLYSRVGFVHGFRPLSAEEMHFILTVKWAELGWTLRVDDFTDTEAEAAIIRITGGNFRLLQRLWGQIERIMTINELSVVTAEVVEAARESLVIGAD